MLSFAAALLWAQAQPAPLPPPLPPSQPPQQEPEIIYQTAPEPAPPPVVEAPPGRKRRYRDGGSEIGVGLGVFMGGYLMGSLIVIAPALFTNKGQDPVHNTGEKRLALIPVAGPMVWWFAARARLDGRSHDDLGVDSAFHNILGLPYAVVATAAQGIGVGLMIYAGVRANEEVAT